MLNNIVPNLVSKKSTLSGFQKKIYIFDEITAFIGIIKHFILVLVVIFVLVLLRLPIPIIVLLCMAEIVSASVGTFIGVKKIKVLSVVATENNAKSYKTILKTVEYYRLIRCLCGFGASIFVVLLTYIFFEGEMSKIIFQGTTLKIEYVVIAFLLYQFIILFFVFTEFVLVRGMSESEDMAQIDKEYLLIQEKLQLVMILLTILIVVVVTYLMKDIPPFISIIFAVLTLIMIVLKTVQIRRLSDVTFGVVDASESQHNSLELQNEIIDGSVFGIMRIGVGWKPLITGASVLGSGKDFFPENTLLVTNLRLIMIQVPVTGSGKIVGDVDYVRANFYFNRAEIRQKGTELLERNSISELIKFATNSVLFEDIKTISLRKRRIVIEKKDGEKMGYLFADDEYIGLLKGLFQTRLTNKFVSN